MTTANKHKYYDIARRAYQWTSFHDEKRAESECAYYDEVCAELTKLGKADAIEKFTRLFLKSLAAKARCASPMITGPARFPVARMKKYNQWEENATKAMFNFVAYVKAPPKEKRCEIDYGIAANDYSLFHAQWGEIKAKNNVEENRLQLFLDGKPSEEVIAKLKQNGFKWSPRFKAWQRQLTPNAITSLRYLDLKLADGSWAYWKGSTNA